ncbi:hypothetical protein C3L33_13864, partial [Rhododendron williamsianum]
MPFPSISILRHLPQPCLAPRTISLRLLSLAVTARRQNPSNNPSRKFQQPSKNLLKARQNTAKHYSNLAPILSPDDRPHLSPNHALGLVAAAQANFMRVIVQSEGSQDHNNNNDNTSNNRVGVELLCVILDPPVANVDHLVVLFSMDQPKIDPFALTRFLVEAESTGIPLTLALNKSELVDQESLEAWKTRLRKWGYEPIFCSVESKHELDTLQFTLREQTSVIVGPSGVGKSSLINALRSHKPVLGATEVDNWFDSMLDSKWFEDQRVGEVSTKSGKGKHTTRNVSLLPLSGGGYLADTPGFSQPSLMIVTEQSLAQYFPELLDEIRIREEFQLRTIGTKREGDVRYKVGDMGVKQAEPRLERKKHRRQSRKTVNQSIIEELDDLDDDDNLLDDSILRALRHESQ